MHNPIRKNCKKKTVFESEDESIKERAIDYSNLQVSTHFELGSRFRYSHNSDTYFRCNSKGCIH